MTTGRVSASHLDVVVDAEIAAAQRAAYEKRHPAPGAPSGAGRDGATTKPPVAVSREPRPPAPKPPAKATPPAPPAPAAVVLPPGSVVMSAEQMRTIRRLIETHPETRADRGRQA